MHTFHTLHCLSFSLHSSSLPLFLPHTPPPSHVSFLPPCSIPLPLTPSIPLSLSSLSLPLSLPPLLLPSLPPLFLPSLPPLLGKDSSHFSQSSQISGLKDLSLSPSLRAHGYLTLGENAQEEVRGEREVGESIER